MTDAQNTTPQNERTPNPADNGSAGSAGQKRPDQGGAGVGKQETDPATGGEGAAGAGGSGGFGT